MSDLAIKALLLPFEKHLIAPPLKGRGFMIRAEASSVLTGEWMDKLVLEQTLKPIVDQLVGKGYEVVQRITGTYDVGLCLLTKHKKENLVNIARAWALLAHGGVLVCAGEKNIGAGSVERLVHEKLGKGGSLSKYHCRVFWVVKTTANAPTPREWSDLDCLRLNIEQSYLSRPGIFGWEKVDAGSHLLVRNLPETIGGVVADFGAGWGYLSIQLLRRFDTIERLDLFEAELLALDAARQNLAKYGLEHRAGFYWHDVTAQLPEGGRYDWVVMNPPFHSERAADTELGRAFITGASRALRPHGCLVMVANSRLPYERHLTGCFQEVCILIEADGFKVIVAKKAGTAA